ncbi:hypothetical protein [Chitinimonas sp.]|uniref:hypothetical protein n=1 Tax=Chitinimonas sp. TaxID=1934313 RepID=UPI0035B43E11
MKVLAHLLCSALLLGTVCSCSILRRDDTAIEVADSKVDEMLRWETPAPEVVNHPEYANAKAAVTEFWKAYIRREWRKCYSLENEDTRKAVKEDFYVGYWRGAIPVKSIKLYDISFKTDTTFSVSLEMELEQSVVSGVKRQPLLMHYEWHRDPDSGRWLRDFRDPLIRPAMPAFGKPKIVDGKIVKQ